jgi:hypothetical protein
MCTYLWCWYFSSTGTLVLVKDNIGSRSLQLVTLHFQMSSVPKTQSFNWQLVVCVMHKILLFLMTMCVCEIFIYFLDNRSSDCGCLLQD